MSDEQLQFDKAEFKEAEPGKMTCENCKIEIGDTYYTVNTAVVCHRCKDAIHSALNPEGGGAGRFLRAFVLGGLAAILGAGLYFAVLKLTGYQFGLIAIVVGLMVGKAVQYGARHRGGWLYQGLAMLLTYTAIVSTYVPFIITGMSDQPEVTESQPAEPVATSGPASSTEPATFEEQNPPSSNIFALVFSGVAILVISFIAPFLGGFENIIGLIIIGIGLYEAWKINRRPKLEIAGPLQVATNA